MPRSLQAATDDRSHKFRCANDIMERAEKENRVTTADENQLFDDIKKEIVSLDNEILQIQEYDQRRKELGEVKAKLEAARGPSFVPAQPGAVAQPAPTVPAAYRRDGKLVAFTGPNAEEKAYRCGMWARAAILGDFRAGNWCANHGIDIRNAQGENVNTAGGYLVPEEFNQSIIDLREQYGVFRQQTEVIPMGRDTMTIPRRAGGVTATFVGENPTSAITESQASWNQVRLTAKKIGALTRMSTEIAEDAVISLADWLAREFAYAFALLEDQCGFIGDGTSTYGGIRGLGNIFTTTGGAGGGQLVGAVDAATGHDTFAEIDVTDIATLMSKLPAYVTDPKFYISKMGAELVFGRLQAAAGGNTTETLSNGRVGRTYLGYPIVISQVLPAITGDLSDVPMFYFGDLRLASIMGDRRQVTVFPSEHRYMDTDQIGIRATERTDIVIHSVGDTTTGVAGPIVAMVGE